MEWLTTIPRTVELGAIQKPTGVMDSNGLSRSRNFAVAGFHIPILQAIGESRARPAYLFRTVAGASGENHHQHEEQSNRLPHKKCLKGKRYFITGPSSTSGVAAPSMRNGHNEI